MPLTASVSMKKSRMASPAGACGWRRTRAGHVDADAVLLVFEGCPVEAEPALEFVEAALAQHDVVAAEALHAVACIAAVEDVVARMSGTWPVGAP